MNYWLKNAIIYNILIDRFSKGKALDSDIKCNGRRFCGGNLRGVIDRLDYLEELGVNTILLTPFNTNSEYHGYHIVDLFGVDERFGTLDDVKKLFDRAHEKGMKVIVDFVINHVSFKHPYFIKAQSNPKSPYINWFHFSRWPDRYLTFLKVKELPKLNLNHPPVKKYIFKAARYWLEMGCDGFRMDHIIGVKNSFWKEFREMVKHTNPSAVVIGEAVKSRLHFKELKTLPIRQKLVLYFLSLLGVNIMRFLMLQYRHSFDGLLDFHFRELAKKYIAKPVFYRPKRLLPMFLKLHYRLFSKDFCLITMLDNPDTDRFLFLAGGDRGKLREVLRFQFTQNQPAMIYQGSEIGYSQKKSRWKYVENGDFEMRPMMRWHSQDRELLNFYKKIISARKSQTDGQVSRGV